MQEVYCILCFTPYPGSQENVPIMERRIGIIVHRTRLEAQAFAKEVVAWLEERGIVPCLDAASATRLGKTPIDCTPEGIASLELLITLGGDGTILTAARLAAPCGVPVLGVHMGRFGFIAEAHPDDLFTHLEAIIAGKGQIEERMMVQADVVRGEETVRSAVGLNEALVKSGMSQLLQLRTFLRDAPFATYPADGIIVATPTGSTGYALSAGGPIVEPTVQAMLIVPICPHTLSARPMIVPANETIEIRILSENDDVLFAVDGVETFPLQMGDRVIIRPANYTTRLIAPEVGSFYRKVRARYLYGERLNE